LGDYDFHPTTIESASSHLRTLLQDKAILLVVDDIWDPDHAKPFCVAGLQSHVLITTRRADVAEEVGAELYQMDVMTPEQSLALLSIRLNHPWAETEQAAALALAKDVGYLPLALELAAARVTRGTTWTNLRAALKTELARLETLEGPHRRRGGARLEASFNLSLNALRAEDEAAWKAFVWLGVLPEDVRLATPMVATLWEMDDAGAAEILELLWNDALLLSAPPILVGERQWPAYRLHDLLHDIARRLLTATSSQGLGLDLPTAHTTLLAHYQKHTHDGLWHTLPDDGYIHAHLTWHMERAAQVKQIHALLREETAEERNGWYEVCERLGQTATFVTDVVRAWRLAEEGTTSAGTSVYSAQAIEQELALSIRYALITASINTLAKNIPSSLLIALVKKNVWNYAQGLTYARQAPNPLQQIEMYIGLIPNLPLPLQDEVMQETLMATRTIEPAEDRLEVLIRLLPCLPEATRTQIVQDELTKVKRAPIEAISTEMIVGLAPYMPEGLQREALTFVKAIEDEHHRGWALRWLAPHLREPLLEEALVIIQEIQDESERAETLANLAPFLPEHLLQKGIIISQLIKDKHKRIGALAGLISFLPEELRKQTSKEALAIAQTIENGGDRLLALIMLIPNLPGELNRLVVLSILSELQVSEIGEDGCKFLVSLGLRLPHDLRELVLQATLSAARATKDQNDRINALLELAPHLAEGLQEQVLQEVLIATQRMDVEGYQLEENEGEDNWPKAMARLAPRYPRPPERLAQFVGPTQPPKLKDRRAEVLVQMAPYLSKPLLQDALAVARTIEYGYRARALAGLAPYLSRPLLIEALQIAQMIEDGDERAEALVSLVVQLPEELRQQKLQETLSAVHLMKSKLERMSEIMRLIPYLPEPIRKETLQEALTTISSVEEGYRVRTLTELAPLLPKPLKEKVLRQALDLALNLPLDTYRSKSRAWALAELSVQFAKLAYPKEALIAVQAINTGERHAAIGATLSLAFGEIAPYLPDPFLREALIIAQTIADYYDRAKILAQLVPHLQIDLMREVLEEAQNLPTRLGSLLSRISPKESPRAWVLVKLASRLAELGYPEEGLSIARSIKNEIYRTEALVETALHLSEELKQKILQEALIVAQVIADSRTKAKVSMKAAMHLLEPLREQTLREALATAQRIAKDQNREEILAELVSQLAKSGHSEEGLKTMQVMRLDQYRVKAFMELAPYLTSPQKEQVLRELLTTVRGIEREKDRAELLAGIASNVMSLSHPTLSSIWRETLPILAHRTRQDLMSDLQALSPIIAALGGPNVIAKTIEAIQDVGRWWP
jgi:hypothetical protein